MFIRAKMWEYITERPRDAACCWVFWLVTEGCSNLKISNFGHKFTLQGRLVCNILRYSQRLYPSIGSFQVFSFVNQDISNFPRWGHFPTNFQSPLAAKLRIGSKKLDGCKNGTDLFYYHAKYGGDRGSRAGCRPKSVMFFCLFVTLWNYELCDNGDAMKQCNFQNNYGVIA